MFSALGAAGANPRDVDMRPRNSFDNNDQGLEVGQGRTLDRYEAQEPHAELRNSRYPVNRPGF
ncbi:MAG: hypothetical protein ACPGYJ_07525 [bacterium]